MTIASIDWSGFSFGALLGGILGGVLVFIILEFIKRQILAPKLTLTFRHDSFGVMTTEEVETYTSLTPEGREITQQLLEPPKPVKYVRVSVTNVGHEAAKGCRGYLVGFERYLGRGNFKSLLFDHLPLSWSYVTDRSAQAVTIPSGRQTIFNLDLLSTRDGERHFSLRLLTFPRFYSGLGREAGKYRLTIHVTCDNASTEELVLYLDWKENWSDFAIESR